MKTITIVGGGLAGSEAALTLADRGFRVRLVEMRPCVQTAVHTSGNFGELVCSNSLKSRKPDSAAGMLKTELEVLGSRVFDIALRHRVDAGGALAVDRNAFSLDVTKHIEEHPLITVERREAVDIEMEACGCDALVLACGPLMSDTLAQSLETFTGIDAMAFFDAAAPIVMADSLDYSKLFRQSRYEDAGKERGDYLNAPFTHEEYESFITELLAAERVIAKDFETRDLFQACQPIEEVARAGFDAPRFGTMKPVGLTDPRTGRRPWAVLQLRAEDTHGQSYNLVGFQTNLTFPEQQRVFRMIPGLEEAQFARYGVMHRNTFINAPRLLNNHSRLMTPMAERLNTPIYVVGQLAGTEGYCEAIRSGLHGAYAVFADLTGRTLPDLPATTVFGSLLAYATNPETVNYQPMHVNFGIIEPLKVRVRNKKERYSAYAQRGRRDIEAYKEALQNEGLL